MDCKLQVFKQEVTGGNSGRGYRFAVVDYSKSKSYPANFVCMLPIKVDNGKSKILNVFEELFGDKSLDFAKELLNQALQTEKDDKVKAEIERRLKLIDPNYIHLIKCCKCKKSFQARKTRKYKQNFCDDCLKARYIPRQ